MEMLSSPRAPAGQLAHGVPMHSSLQELDQVAAGRNPKPPARDAASLPTLQARAEADLQPVQYHKILLTGQYQIHYLG